MNNWHLRGGQPPQLLVNPATWKILNDMYKKKWYNPEEDAFFLNCEER